MNSRAIKFRVWDNFHKTIPARFWYSEDAGMSSFWQWVSQHTNTTENVQQFTGLFDINRREIYEGDIISHSFKDGKKTISLYQLIQWEHLPAGDDMDMDSYGYHINPHWGGQYEIVGNIFENPELIKKCNE